MEQHDLSLRVARLEGRADTLKWSVGVVSAALLAALAVVVGLQLYTLSQVHSVEAQVQALPDQINRNLLELNRALSEAITATRSGQMTQQPIIIQVPERPSQTGQ